MKNYSIVLLFLFALVSFEVHSQNSREKADQNYEDNDFDSARLNYLKAINELKTDSSLAHVNRKLADIYMNESRFDSSQYYIDQAMIIAQRMNDSLLIGNLYMDISWQNSFKGELPMTLEYALKAERLFRKFDDKKELGICLSRIAVSYHDMQEDSLAMKFLNEGMDILADIDDQEGLARAYQQMGYFESVYLSETQDEDKFNSSLENYEKALKLFREQKRIIPEANVLNAIGSLYQTIGKLDIASDYLKESLAITKKAKSGIGIAWNYYQIADNYYLRGELETSFIFADSCYNTAKKHDIMDARSSALQLKTQIYYDRENYKDALETYMQYSDLNDTIYDNANFQKMQELQAEFESAQKDIEVSEANYKTTQEKTRRNFLLIILFVGGLLSFFVINREVKRRKKAKELLASEKKLRDLEEARLKEKIDYKNRELTSLALQIAQKNEMLNDINNDLQGISDQGGGEIRGLQNKLKIDSQMDKFWDQFTQQFNETHSGFIKGLSKEYSNLTKNELRLTSLIRMNLSTKEMAAILNVTDEGIKKARYRLRKKLNLETDEGLEQHLLKF